MNKTEMIVTFVQIGDNQIATENFFLTSIRFVSLTLRESQSGSVCFTGSVVVL